MLRRFSINYAVLTMILDMGVTLFLCLWLFYCVKICRKFHFLNLFPLSISLSRIYLVVPIIWVLAFLVASVYDPRHTYRLVDELQVVSLGSLLAALLCAGLFFLTFRELSRWLFVTFLMMNITLLIGWRLVARLFLRIFEQPGV